MGEWAGLLWPQILEQSVCTGLLAPCVPAHIASPGPCCAPKPAGFGPGSGRDQMGWEKAYPPSSPGGPSRPRRPAGDHGAVFGLGPPGLPAFLALQRPKNKHVSFCRAKYKRPPTYIYI